MIFDNIVFSLVNICMNFIKVHKIYKNYGYNVEDNKIIHIPTNNIVKQNIGNSGYCTNSFYFDNKIKTMNSHRFIYECCNDIITKCMRSIILINIRLIIGYLI